MNKIVLGVDKITCYGPKVDGSYKITLETGEYEKDKVAEILKLEPTNYKVTIEDYDG